MATVMEFAVALLGKLHASLTPCCSTGCYVYSKNRKYFIAKKALFERAWFLNLGGVYKPFSTW